MSIDLIVYLTALSVLLSIAFIFARKSSNGDDYFLGQKDLPWWAIAGSIVATETSSLTVIGFPAMTYASNFNFLQIAMGYIIGRYLIAQYLLPDYFAGTMKSSYSYLADSYGKNVQKQASLMFLCLRLLGDAVRLYAGSIPLAMLSGLSPLYCMVLIMIFTFIFSFFGGFRSIVWTDLTQLLFYLIGALLSLVWLLNQDLAWSSVSADKLQIFNFTWDLGNSSSFFWGVTGGILLTLSSHGTDQLIVQRILASKNLQEGKRALIASAWIVWIQIALFLLIGLGLYLFYNAFQINNQIQKANEVFPYFIVHFLPDGFRAMMIIAIFAAAISTLSSTLNAIASTVMYDWLNGRVKLLHARLLTVLTAIVLIVLALFFENSQQNVVDLALSIASLIYGPTLFLFVARRKKWQIQSNSLIIAFYLSILIVMAIWAYPMITPEKKALVAWTLFIPIGFICTAIFVLILNRLIPNKKG